ncbi:MAG: hypothetical protein AB8B85_04600 [Paracoccaceae bacterium]
MTTDVTYTALEFCTEALRECGVVGIRRAASAAEEAVALKRLNMMLKAWQNTGITVWKQTSASITVTDATASYAIASRPIRIETVNRKDGNETWLTPVTRQEYNELPDKASAGTTSSFYYHRQRDQGLLHVWPVPATGVGTLEWSGTAEVEDITSGTDVMDIPSEWYEATHYGLAYRLLGAFPSITEARAQFITINAQRAYSDAKGNDIEDSVTFSAGH